MLQNITTTICAMGLAILFTVTGSFGQVSSEGEVAADPYVIGPEDTLLISVWREAELTREVLVRSDGKISLPLIDEVQAAGLTPLRLKKVITERLQEHVTDVWVSVIVQDPRNFKVYVTGKVGTPGVQIHRSKPTVMQALALAGGLAESADERQILLIRKSEGVDKRSIIDYGKIVSGERADMNLDLQPGDTIVVPEWVYQVTVIGNVNTPGTFTARREMTFLEAISRAEGLNEWASKKIILVGHEQGKETRRVINYKKVISGEELDQNVVLKNGDTVIVP